LLAYLFSYRQALVLYTPILLGATLTTLIISLISVVLAILLGGISVWGRLSKLALLRWLAIAYVELVRGTPTLVQLLIWGFGVNNWLTSIGFDPYQPMYQLLTALQSNSLMPPKSVFNFMVYGILGLGFNYGAYLTEVFRTGIESVAKGQTEAALSLGMNSQQTMGRIVLPQAIRLIVPPLTNYFITLIQDTALLSVLGGIGELQLVTSQIAFPLTDANLKLFIFVFGGLFYLLLCYPLSLLARYLERRLNPKGA
jgi:His/Glu/Gln/Arg/opine family amino acid ABC transporter permease subunit